MTDSNASIKQLVQSQFAPAAQAYVISQTHAHGVDLARLVELAAFHGHERVLDVATGGGHTALACAPYVQHVVASDLTTSMLRAARHHIYEHATTNVSFCRADAEVLPFATASFDIVTCRVAAHHFAEVQAFVSETARVLRPGGRLLVSDHIGLEDAELDNFMDRFERWRDPSHVRAHTYTQWRRFCAAAGLHVTTTEDDQREAYDFPAWTSRLRMPSDERDALEQWLLAAPERYRTFFAVQARDGKVTSLQGTFGIVVAQK